MKPAARSDQLGKASRARRAQSASEGMRVELVNVLRAGPHRFRKYNPVPTFIDPVVHSVVAQQICNFGQLMGQALTSDHSSRKD